MTRLLRRYGRYLAGGVVLGGAAVVALPKEMLPAPLLPTRVLVEGMGRVGHCALTGGLIFLDYAYLRYQTHRHSAASSSLSAAEWEEAAWGAVHTRSAQRLVHLAESNGGLYVKAGQIFANMSHVLPLQYTRVMAGLQDKVAPRPYREVVAVLEADLRQPFSEIFSYIDPVPTAAASLAQVHRGHLAKEDVDVAIKVQYIDIAQRFRGDMRTIDLMLRVAGYFYRGFDFGEVLRKLNSTVAAELDFCLEARNSDRVGRDLRAGGFGDRVVCARLFHDYITSRVLVSQFVCDGVKISDAAGLRSRRISLALVTQWFVDAMAYQFFVSGFFHGDPHAGNVLVHNNPATGGKPQVVLIDFGLCGEFTPAQRIEMADIWTAAVVHDNATLQKIASHYGTADYALFASCFLQHPYVYYNSRGARLIDRTVQELMRDTMTQRMTEVNKIVASLSKEYALVMRGIMATKAINRELGDVVNRPLRMLRYSLLVSHHSSSRIKLYYALMRAWLMEQYSACVVEYAKWRNPAIAHMLNGPLQVAG